MTTAAMNSGGLPSSHLEKDPSSLSLPKVERVQFKLDGSNRTSYAPQFQVNSSSDHPMVTAPTWSIQTQSASMAKSGQEYRLSNLTSAKAEGTIDASTSQVPTQTARDQSSRPFITQTAPVNLPSIHQAVQGMSFVQAPSPGNSHNEIAKLIQKLLQLQHPEHPKWTPPSRDYLNKALTCQKCQLTINEVDNVLISDACEEGYHLKCLQSNQNGIPRSEWHCMGCLALTQGKPLPPKYGRVMRSSMNQPNLSSDIAMKVSSLEKKVGTLHPKVNQLKMTANGSSGLWSPAHVGTADTNYVDSASDIKIPDARENQGNNSASSIKNVDEKPFAGVHTNIPLKPLSVGSSSVNSIQNAKDCELSTREERSFEEEIDPPAKVSEKVGNNPYHSLPSHNSHVDWRDLSNCAGSIKEWTTTLLSKNHTSLMSEKLLTILMDMMLNKMTNLYHRQILLEVCKLLWGLLNILGLLQMVCVVQNGLVTLCKF
ncbi:hypothetical protein I3760_12G130800 [Carya illinoinensis]|nr:hypothetical protein I3760_12G130800 [Carya illinoinensis]